jgi:hypothetical protein
MQTRQYQYTESNNKPETLRKGKCIHTVNSMALKKMPQRPTREAEVQVYSFFNFGARGGEVVNDTPRPL